MAMKCVIHYKNQSKYSKLKGLSEINKNRYLKQKISDAHWVVTIFMKNNVMQLQKSLMNLCMEFTWNDPKSMCIFLLPLNKCK